MIPVNRHGDCSAPLCWQGSPAQWLLSQHSHKMLENVSPVLAPVLVMHLISLLQSSAEVYDEQEILDIATKVTKHVVPIFPRSMTGPQHAQGLARLQMLTGQKCRCNAFCGCRIHPFCGYKMHSF